MINRSKYIVIACVAICCMLWGACTQERSPCLLAKVASLNIETAHLPTDSSTTFIDTILPSAMFGAMTTAGPIQYFVSVPQALFTISLSPDTDSCRWMFTTDTLSNHVFDTISFYYGRKLQFLSNACGYTYFYNLTSVTTTHHNIDSFLIENNNVTTNVNTEHLKLYIHPDF
jgi:hypothetical protein